MNHTVIDARNGILRAAQDSVLMVLRPSLEKLTAGWGDTKKPEEMALTKASLMHSLNSFAQVLSREFLMVIVIYWPHMNTPVHTCTHVRTPPVDEQFTHRC